MDAPEKGGGGRTASSVRHVGFTAACLQRHHRDEGHARPIFFATSLRISESLEEALARRGDARRIQSGAADRGRR